MKRCTTVRGAPTSPLTTGFLCRFSITPGQDHDALATVALLIDLQDGQIILGDKTYDADWIRRRTEEQGVAPNIPDRSNRTQRYCFQQDALQTPQPRRAILEQDQIFQTPGYAL